MEYKTRCDELCISVKLKNLKANHNLTSCRSISEKVVYIRKVKKSESKSQQVLFKVLETLCCVYP